MVKILYHFISILRKENRIYFFVINARLTIMSFLDTLRNSLPSNEYFKEGVDDTIPGENMGVNDLEVPVPTTDEEPDISLPDDDDDFVEDELEKPESLELSPEEDAEADSLINIAATPVILADTLAKESVEAFVNSSEFDIAVEEGFCMEGTKDSFLTNDNSVFMEAKFYNKNVVRFTKQARTNQLFEICVQAIARAKNDPVYNKLSKVQVMRRKLKAVLRQRYKAPAMKKAKEYIIRMRKSASPTLANAAKSMTGK